MHDPATAIYYGNTTEYRTPAYLGDEVSARLASIKDAADEQYGLVHRYAADSLRALSQDHDQPTVARYRAAQSANAMAVAHYYHQMAQGLVAWAMGQGADVDRYTRVTATVHRTAADAAAMYQRFLEVYRSRVA